MTTWYRVQGDTSDTIDVGVQGISDATAASAWEGHVWATGGTPTTLSATAISATTVRVNLGTWLTSAPVGQYNFEIQATIAALPRTWPEGPSPDTIAVRAQGA